MYISKICAAASNNDHEREKRKKEKNARKTEQYFVQTVSFVVSGDNESDGLADFSIWKTSRFNLSLLTVQ